MFEISDSQLLCTLDWDNWPAGKLGCGKRHFPFLTNRGGTCSVSGCAPSPELDLQDRFWLMKKNRHLRRTTDQEFFSFQIRILGETRNKSSAKKSLFRFSGARRFFVKSSRVLYDACWTCHENSRRVHFTVFCQIYFA